MALSAEKHHINDILKAKKERLVSIFEIAKKQAGLLEKDDIETLVGAIETRQKLVDEISALDKHIEENNLKKNEAYKDSEAQSLLAQIQSVLREIAAKDKENIKSAEEKVAQYRKQIHDTKKDKNRIVSYQKPPGSGDGIYFDKKK